MKQKALIISSAFIFSTILVLAVLSSYFDFKKKDLEFNAFLTKHDLKSKSVLLNSIDSSSILYPSATIISRHSYSFKESIDNYATSALVDALAGSFMEKLFSCQHLSLADQFQLGITNFAIKISKNNQDVLTIDHGIVYGFFDDFIEELESIEGITDVSVQVFYQISEYSPRAVEIGDILQQISLKKTKANIVFSFMNPNEVSKKDSSDFAQVLTLIDDEEFNFYILAIYRSGTKVAIVLIMLFLVFWLSFIILAYIAYRLYNK